MFSFSSSFSNPFTLPRFLGGDPGTAIDLRPVTIHDVETSQEKKARTLKHLLKLNHTNHSIIYHNLQFHNHTPHILGSTYILGATPEHLNHVYEEVGKHLEPWQDSPGEVSTFDWRDYLGDARYQRAYVDFFEDQLVHNGYDWKQVVSKYLFEGEEPLINNLISGLGHPLIHLGYAYELSSREVAMEALGLATCFYSYLHKYLDDPKYTKPSRHGTSFPHEILEILQNVSKDKRFDNLGGFEIDPIFKHAEAAILEHWNSWQLTNPKKQFEDSQRAAVALLVGTVEPGSGAKYDFFLVHLLTTTHAVRILLPMIPAKFHIPLVRQWWLLTLAGYIAQSRPKASMEYITEYDLEDKDWDWVDKQALESKWATDEHFVKGLRAMKVAAETWGDEEKFYLKAACKFGDEFDGWGFG